jgi:hypothetical protein
MDTDKVNPYIDSIIIRCLKDRKHTVSYNDAKAIDRLRSFPTQIRRLIIKYSPEVGFTASINSTIPYNKVWYSCAIRCNGKFQGKIRLNIFLIYSLSIYQIDEKNRINQLFQVILSNGFSRLQICTTIRITAFDVDETFLVLSGQTLLIHEQLLSLCSNLLLLKSMSNVRTDQLPGIMFFLFA